MSYKVLINPRAPRLKVYEEDFDKVVEFFSMIVSEGKLSALPGSVIDTYVPSAESYAPLTMTANEYRGYRMDSGSHLASDKNVIAAGLSLVEGRNLSANDFTLCPSVSYGLLCIMLALRRMAVPTFVAELPAYFASIEQATSLGFRTYLWPTLREEKYTMTAADVSELRSQLQGPLALLVTQPKYGMGHSRSLAELISIRDSLSAGDFLIVDEAADQTVPASLGRTEADGGVTLLRVRGLTKGLGLNSARLAAIFHPHRLREMFAWIVEYSGGTLDSASLKLAKSFMSVPSDYADLLEAASSYVRSQRRLLKQLVVGTGIVLSPLESGYIGTAHIPLESGPSSFDAARRRFLETCKEQRMPVVLGSSMYFPYDGSSEIIRVNYFSSEANIRNSGKALSLVMKTIKRPP